MEAAMTQMQMMADPHADALVPGSRMQTIARLARRRHARISGGGRPASLDGVEGACGSGISGGGERSWCPFTTTAEPETAGRT